MNSHRILPALNRVDAPRISHLEDDAWFVGREAAALAQSTGSRAGLAVAQAPASLAPLLRAVAGNAAYVTAPQIKAAMLQVATDIHHSDRAADLPGEGRLLRILRRTGFLGGVNNAQHEAHERRAASARNPVTAVFLRDHAALLAWAMTASAQRRAAARRP